MRSMIVEVSREIEQFAFEIRRGPEQGAIQEFTSDRADESFHKWMGQRDIRYGLDFVDFEDSKIGLPLSKAIKRIMVGAEVLGHPALPSDGTFEHPAKCDTIDGSGMHAEADDAAGVLIHDDQDPVGPQCNRFTPEQIDTPEAILHEPQEGQPGRAGAMLFRSRVTGENPANRVFVDWDAESQGDLLSDAGTTPGGIAQLHLDDGFNDFLIGSLGTGPAPALG